MASGFVSTPTERDSNRKRGLTSDSQRENGNRRKLHKVSRACDLCKRAKSKCSGTLPCDNCTKRAVACVYDAKYSRGRPPTPPPGRMSERLSSSGINDVQTPHNQTNDLGNDNISSRRGGRVVSFRTEHDEEDSETSRDSISPVERVENQGSRGSPELEVAEIEGQLVDPNSGLTFLHRAWKRLATQKSAAPLADCNEKRQMWMAAGDEPFDPTNASSLIIPDRSTATSLLSFYFDTCVVTYRFLHQPTVMAWLDIMENNVENNLSISTTVGNARAAIVLTLLAIATIRQEKMQEAPSSEDIMNFRHGDQFFCAAAELLSERLELGIPRLESAQARLIQVLYLLQTSRMNQGWYIFGNCLQMVSALGLHRKSGRKRSATPRGTSTSQLDYITTQYRKRTFWVAYTIDAYLGVVFGRPRHYHDEDIDQDYPDSVNDEDMMPNGPSKLEASEDCHVDSLIFHAKLARIIGVTSREVYSTKEIPVSERLAAAHRLSIELEEWNTNLPIHLGSVRPSSLIPSFRRQAMAMQLAHAHAVLHVNRPFLMHNATGSRRISLLSQSARDCIEAAKKALLTIDSMVTDGSLFHAFWWTHYVTFCALAVVYVLEIQQKASTGGISGEHYEEDLKMRQLFELAERCHSYLSREAAANSPSRRYSVILEELRMEARHQPEKQIGFGNIGAVAGNPSADADSDGDMDAPGDPSGSNDIGALIDHATGNPGLYDEHTFWNDWQTTNWLDLDSSAFGPLSDPGESPLLWSSELTDSIAITQ